MIIIANRLKLAAAVGILLAIVFGGSVQTQSLVFEEPFDDPDLSGWEHSPGVEIDGGVLRVEPDNFAFLPSNWGDSRVVAQIKLEGEGEAVIGYRAAEWNSFKVVLGPDFIAAQREQNREIFELDGVGGITIPHGEWFQFELILVEGLQQVFINEQLVLEMNDLDPYPEGGILFHTIGAVSMEVDHFAVYDPDVPGGENTPQSEEEEAAPPPAEISFDGDLTWVRTGGPLGGLGYDVRMHPENPDIMYVTDALAGVFKSTDSGKNWFPSNQGITVRTGPSQDDIPIFCLSIDPNHPGTIWAGTQGTRGIFKSENEGASWVIKVNGIVENNGITFRGITVDPKNSQIIYAAAELSSWVWSGGEQPGREFDKVAGVVYKSTNGGDNWQAIWRGDNLARYILIDPRDSNVLYISTGIFDREAADSDAASDTPGGEGVLKSTDGGQTWNQINNGLTNLYIGTLSMHPENPDILLAGAANNAYREGAGVFLTTDGGQIWTRVLEEEAQAVEFSPSNPMIAYAGNPSFIFRSEDGGLNWEKMDPQEVWGAPGVPAGFPIDFEVDPRNPDRIFANNYGGGNFLSEDGGRTWTDASAGYTGALIRDLATSPTEPGVVYAAGRSGIFISTNGGGDWVGLIYPEAHGLDWNTVAIDPQDQHHILATSNWNKSINNSPDGGLSWSLTHFPELTMQGGRVIVFSPSDPQSAYAGFGGFYSAGSFDNNIPASGVYASRDGGGSWSPANDGLTSAANVTGLAVHPTNPQVVFMTSPASGLFKTEDSGVSWTEISGLPGNVRPFSVAINPANHDLMLMGTDGNAIYRSVDAGQTWTRLSAGLPPESVISTVIFHPIDPNIAFCADIFSGVYHSSDQGQTWQVINTGLTSRAVNSLAISADGWHLYAATEGGGVFRLDLNGQPPEAGQPLIGSTQPEEQPLADQPEKELQSPPLVDVEPADDQPDDDGEFTPPPLTIILLIVGAIIVLTAVIIIVIFRSRGD